MKKKKNKKKSKKKIIIGAAVILVAAGGIRVVGQKNAAENQTPQVPVVTAGTGDVEEIVDASGTVGSEEEKTYYSPVNAELKTVSFSQGDVVKKGTKLIEFETENLEKDNQRAELNLKSTRSDIKDTVNKSGQQLRLPHRHRRRHRHSSRQRRKKPRQRQKNSRKSRADMKLPFILIRQKRFHSISSSLMT